ncbi:hypothetical protein F1559_001621 [Cyanidiococcus yangmingshanensis]|uniref:CHCH domain-containing protein n=1 Tax=Cyanidiococcus yangmingshanensis TaxID=2690220 RepID=A0A7J7IL72_9RHOD|nr:hypothetical protein F1559_001621 [Cyanidiococcus yangmingshanensis]
MGKHGGRLVRPGTARMMTYGRPNAESLSRGGAQITKAGSAAAKHACFKYMIFAVCSVRDANEIGMDLLLAFSSHECVILVHSYSVLRLKHTISLNMSSKSNVSRAGNSLLFAFRSRRALRARRRVARFIGAARQSESSSLAPGSCREPIQRCGDVSMAVHSLMTANDETRPSSSTPNCDIEQVLELHGCRAAYERLEECLGEHDRDWSACQEPLRLLRDCYEARRQNTDEHSRSSRNAGTIQR